jgi:hypothetical protein
MTPLARDRPAVFLVVAVASAVAVVSARPWPGSWNDASRLATVESLVDRHTFAIDDSIFVRPPRADAPPEGENAGAMVTQDKLFIAGRFYSDKPPVASLPMAGLYQAWRWSGGAAAPQRPDRFCYWMTLCSSGVAYVVAVASMFVLGRTLRLPLSRCLVLTASFAFATVALPYARHVNAHIVLLGIAAMLFAQLARAGDRSMDTRHLLAVGALAGFAYGVDLAAGPLLLAITLALVAHRQRRIEAVLVCGLAALPVLLLHHALNYAIGGTILPANTVPEYLRWPGSPFDRSNMTGVWQHDGIGQVLTYGLALLVGRRGFLNHNLPLWLAAVGTFTLLKASLGGAAPSAPGRNRMPETPQLLCGAAWCAATWLVYALTSTNYSGECASIRWFVPFLVPGYFLLAVLLRERPQLYPYFLILTGWGAVLAVRMWWYGPWVRQMGPLFWPLQGAALVSCVAWYARQCGVRLPFAPGSAESGFISHREAAAALRSVLRVARSVSLRGTSRSEADR